MQVKVTGEETSIKLNVLEQKRLADAKAICLALAKHDDSESAKSAALKLGEVIASYGAT